MSTVNYVPRFIAPVDDGSPNTTALLGSTVSGFGGFFDVKAYGAKGDASTNDTAAIQRAITDALAVKGIVWFPRGWYKSGALTLSGSDYGCALMGEAWNSNLAESPEFGGTVIELISGTNDTLFTVGTTCAPVHFENLYLRGNQAGQTADTSYAVNFPDSASAARSGTFHRVRIERWRNGGVRIGTFRDAGQMDQCVFLNNGFDSAGNPVGGGTGADGITMASCNDWRFNRIDTGANSRNGMYLVSAGTVLANNVNCFSNIKRGIQIDATCQTINFYNGSLDRNLQEGLLIVGSTSTTKCHARTFVGYVFSGNGNQTNNTYSDVRINNESQGFTTLANCAFTRGSFSNYPKYCVETQGTTAGVIVSEPLYRTDANAPYATSFTNDVTKVTGNWVSNADAAVNGYVWGKDAGGTMRKFATIA